MSGDLPPMTARPCVECPWRRESAAGWLGPMDCDEWIFLAHSDEPIACHLTLDEDHGWDDPGVRQCRGAAIYRANVGKMSRDPDVERAPKDVVLVFGSRPEFVNHHNGWTATP